jgi:thymidylate kinase
MTLILIDGPEKAGKTTLTELLKESYGPNYVTLTKWTERDRDDGLGMVNYFQRHINSKKVHIWDRGWVSEVVYGQLLKQERQMSEDPMLAEWIYSRPLIGQGVRGILLPKDPYSLSA